MADTANDFSWLLGRVAGGDQRAFELLYDATSSKLYGIVLRILRRRDLAEDVVQEVYVKIWDRAAEFNPARGSPMNWMATMARNRALDEVRKKSHVSIEDRPDVLQFASSEPLPLAALEACEEARRLRACLDRLEPIRREIVLSAYFDGSSREELSKRLGHPVNTIKTWLHRSLAQLKACLSP